MIWSILLGFFILNPTGKASFLSLPDFLNKNLHLALMGEQSTDTKFTSLKTDKTVSENNLNPPSLPKIEFLKKFTEENQALEIHNKALQFLKNDQKSQALLLLKKNAYQNLFLPSYISLFHLKIPFSLAPLSWHISLFSLALLCFLLLILLFKNFSFSRLKLFFWSLSLFGCVIFSGLFLLKKRVGVLQETELKSLPFTSAPLQSQLPPHLEAIILKQTKHWLRIQAPNQQTGWVLKQKVFRIF